MIEAESGLRTVNLAAARCPTVMTYFAFRRALEAGRIPQAIVINTKQAVLLGSPDYNGRYWQAVLSPWECLELGVIGRRPKRRRRTMGCLFPSLRSRLEIRSTCSPRWADIPTHSMTSTGCSGGTGPSTTVPTSQVTSRYRGELPRTSRNASTRRLLHRSEQCQGRREILRLAPVATSGSSGSCPPLSAGLAGLRDRSGSEAQFEKWVRSFQAKVPRAVTVVDARHVVSDPAMFIDATHLAGRGAIALSRSVGKALKAELARPVPPSESQWIVLEASHEDPHAAIALSIEGHRSVQEDAWTGGGQRSDDPLTGRRDVT